jgi:hypothetical protein
MPMFMILTLRDGGRPLHVNPDHIVAVFEIAAPGSGACTVVSTTAGDHHQVQGTVEEVLTQINPPRLPSRLGPPAPRTD